MSDSPRVSPLTHSIISLVFIFWVLRPWTFAVLSALLIPNMQDREGNGTPLQYFCLENPMDLGAWWAAVHGVAKSRTYCKLSCHKFLFNLDRDVLIYESIFLHLDNFYYDFKYCLFSILT